MYVDSANSLYFLTYDAFSDFLAYVIKVGTIGDLTATIATISAAGVKFEPWGLN